MNAASYATRFTVDNSPAEVFTAINAPRAWWTTDITEIDGSDDGRISSPTDRADEDFVFEVPASTTRRSGSPSWSPGSASCGATIDFVEDTDEWTDTEIRFEISQTEAGTTVTFTHDGLAPTVECYDACSNAWGLHVGGSLRNLITTGTGRPGPNPDEERYQDAGTPLVPARSAGNA